MPKVMELAWMCAFVYPQREGYQEGYRRTVHGWRRTEALAINPLTGFYGALFERGDEIVMCLRGTDMGSGWREARKDWETNVTYGLFGMVPTQFNDVMNFYTSVRDRFASTRRLYVTGHSLGGALTQMLLCLRGGRGITFNSAAIPGFLAAITRTIRTENRCSVINLRVEGDPINAMPGTLIGETRYLATTYSDKHSIDYLAAHLSSDQLGESQLGALLH